MIGDFPAQGGSNAEKLPFDDVIMIIQTKQAQTPQSVHFMEYTLFVTRLAVISTECLNLLKQNGQNTIDQKYVL